MRDERSTCEILEKFAEKKKQIAAGVRRAFGLSARGKPAARSYSRQRSVIDCCSKVNH